MSRVLRAQEGKPPDQYALNSMGRFATAQNFYGYQNDPGTEVDITGTLYLETEDAQELPGLKVRMVPGQHDDLLISAPDKDFLGWSGERYPDFFELLNFGIAVPRETLVPLEISAMRETEPDLLESPRPSESPTPEQAHWGVDRQWAVEQQVAVRSNEVVEVRVSRQRSTGGRRKVPGHYGLSPRPPASLV